MTNSQTRMQRTRKRKKKDPLPLVAVSDEFFNRDLSWLEFNRRVLYQARDVTLPILERLKFLTIFISNLDEFFMNRIGGLKQKVSAGITRSGSVSGSLSNHLAVIGTRVSEMLAQLQHACYAEILPGLRERGILLLEWQQLTAAERSYATGFFHSMVFPILTPQAVDPGHPFPFISNLSLSLGVELTNPTGEESLFARVKIPSVLPQIFRLESNATGSEIRLVSLNAIVKNNLTSLFPGMIVQSVMPFRVTRNGDLDLDEEETDDIVQLIQEELRERKFARVVRLEHGASERQVILKFLMDELELADEDVYLSAPSMDYGALRELCELPVHELKLEPWVPVVPQQLSDEDANMFAVIRSSDILVHHPYEAFSASVDRFLRTAADDPKVLAIKMTLYRAGDNSSLVPLLIRAAEQDKQVVCLIEVKANFDEARNIRLGQLLEEAGVHVLYGMVGLKTHAKVILVVRREVEGIRCYAHVGTGNYNGTTARLYTDLGIFTSNTEICQDLIELFNYLTGRSLKTDYNRLLVAPTGLKDNLVKLVEREVHHHENGRPAHIVIKVNGLEDATMCRALQQAAQKGVPVDLIVRGICCLKPTFVEDGGSGEITPTVISVVSRFLEHSRVFYFRNGEEGPANGEMFISSADLMYRNLHRRVEVAIPLLDSSVREQCWKILSVMLNDNVKAWHLRPDGTYHLRTDRQGVDNLSSQETLMRLYRGQNTTDRSDH